MREAPVYDRFLERRRIRWRLHCRRQKLLPHQRRRRYRTLRLHSLLRFQHPGEDASGSLPLPVVHGLSRQSALQRQYAPALPGAGQPRRSDRHCGGVRRQIHGLQGCGEREGIQRQMRRRCGKMGACGGPAVAVRRPLLRLRRWRRRINAPSGECGRRDLERRWNEYGQH